MAEGRTLGRSAPMPSWKAKAERGSAWLIHLIAWLARAVGRPCCRLLLYPIVLYFVVTDSTARRASREFLTAARDRPARWVDVFRHVYCFAATLLDRVYMASGDFDRFEVQVEGDALVGEALASGKGCVLLGSHLGSFDLMSLKNKVTHDRPVTILMHFDDRSRVRRIAGVDDDQLSIIPLGRFDSYLRAYDVIAKGGIVVALADRVEGASSLQSEFLGRAAPFPIGPHALAARAGARLLIGFGLYEGGSRYRIDILDCGPPAPAGSRGAALQPVVDRYAALLEQHARRHPENWFNFFPFWEQKVSAVPNALRSPTSWEGVWIAIPAYNEEHTIRGLAESALGLGARVMVIDDGSSDATAERVGDLPLTLIRHAGNRGKAASLRTAFGHALAHGARCVVTIDGDGQHDPADAPALVRAWEANPHAFVIGARLHDAAAIPRARYLANRFACFWISWAAGHPIADSQSGFRVYSSEVMAIALGERVRGSGFTFESEILIEAARLGHPTRSVRMPARYPAGARASHYRAIADTTKIVVMVGGRLLRRGLYVNGLWNSLRRRPDESPPASSRALPGPHPASME